MAKLECCWKCPDNWSDWSEWLAAGLHARNRWRLPVLLLGILFASGRRTVTTWLRAAGVSDDFQDYYYLLIPIGRKSEFIATRLLALILRTLPLPERLLLVIDDSPTKRYGPESRRGGRSSQSHAGTGRSAVLVRTYLGDDLAGTATSPLGCNRSAFASHALCPQTNRGKNSQGSPLAAFCHEAASGCAIGGVDRSDPEKSGKNGVDRRRRRLYQVALPAARCGSSPAWLLWVVCAKTRPCEICRRS